jgi:hypothetical protein
MKVSHQGQMRNAIEKILNAFRRAPIFFDTAVHSSRRLMGKGMLEDVDVAAVSVPQQDAKTLLLIDLDSRDQKGPERVSRDVDIHGVENPAGGN